MMDFDVRVKRRTARVLTNLAQRMRIATYSFLSDAVVHGRPTLLQPLHAVGLGRVAFGTGVQLGVWPSPLFLDTCQYFEARWPHAEIHVGDGTTINNEFKAIAEHTAIIIGRSVLIGTAVEIYDSDFHGRAVVDRKHSHAALAKPVILEDEVFLGSAVRIGKGVRIGAGTIVAHGSVVVKNLPAGVVAGGNPATVIGDL